MRLLMVNEIEVKVKQVKKNGLVALLYKTARTDMDLLDEEFGAENWQCAYEEIKGNMYCKIGVLPMGRDEWVWKQDCGIESREDGEGNEKKGEASDAFKRAGFKWGIGRELYTAPFIWISSDYVDIQQNGQKFTCNEKFAVSKIKYNDKREIIALEIVNSKGKVVYTFGTKTPLKTEKTTEKSTKKTTDIPINDLVGDEIPFTAPVTAHPDDWLSVNAFAGEMERCNSLDEIGRVLNGQKGNPHIKELIPLASARKAEILDNLQMEI